MALRQRLRASLALRRGASSSVSVRAARAPPAATDGALRSRAGAGHTRCAGHTRPRSAARASGGGGGGGGAPAEPPPPRSTAATLATGAAALAALATLAATAWREPIEDALLGDGLGDGGLLGAAGALGAGDALAALLWAASLWFISPLQLLVIFFGIFERERPSDALMRAGARAAGLDVDAVDYAPPAWLQAAAAAAFLAAGGAVAWALNAALGDATWAVSSGVGACFGAAMYEAGRPRRLSRGEAEALERQWQDFRGWADARLQRGGRCHESEVAAALRRELARYRAADALPDDVLRDMLRNWAGPGGLRRTRGGYVQGVSLRPRVDAFTGERTGVELPAPAAAAARRRAGGGEGGGEGAEGAGGGEGGGGGGSGGGETATGSAD